MTTSAIVRLILFSFGGALLALAYFPARYVWDISTETARGGWAFVTFFCLVGLGASFIGLAGRKNG